ncbi:MAG TPA: hypothetical protein VF544_17080 [Pyrinomonadaceae bacterium]
MSKRSWLSRLGYLLMGAPLVVLAVYIPGWGWYEAAVPEYAAYAPLFLIVLEILSLAGAFLFIASAFDVTVYRFDKAQDSFLIRGRKLLFKRWAASGPMSSITGVSCEVRGDAESSHSEICLTYRSFGVVTETLRCGTGEAGEDESIADTIRTFLGLRS